MLQQSKRLIEPTRRQALAAGGTALGSLIVGPGFSRAAECLLTSRQIDGPYHISDVDNRSDVRGGKPGEDLILRMKVVDAGTCEAIAGVEDGNLVLRRSRQLQWPSGCRPQRPTRRRWRPAGRKTRWTAGRKRQTAKGRRWSAPRVRRPTRWPP